MIKDNIKNSKNYYYLSNRVALGLEYLTTTDFGAVENGKYPILNDEVFAIVQDYHSKPLGEGKFEAHKKYIDIQYVVKGEELIGVGKIENFSEVTEYDSEKDIVFLHKKTGENVNFIDLKSNEFSILMPEDAHMPSISKPLSKPSDGKTSSYVKKVVIKILNY